MGDPLVGAAAAPSRWRSGRPTTLIWLQRRSPAATLARPIARGRSSGPAGGPGKSTKNAQRICRFATYQGGGAAAGPERAQGWVQGRNPVRSPRPGAGRGGRLEAMEQITDPATPRSSPDANRPPFADQPPFVGQPPLAEPPRAARPAFRLRRSRTDRMLAGVCGGLAD